MTSTLVVGAGILGLSVAAQLARGGARVTVVDSRHPGAGATSTSFAWVNSSQKLPPPYYRLNLEGMAEHARLAGERAPWLRRTGHLWWARPGVEQQHLDAVRTEMADQGYPVEVVDRRQALELEPNLVLPEDVESVTSFPSEAHCFPMLLLAHYLHELRRHGGVIEHPRTATRLEPSADGARVTFADGTSEIADTVVVCAGVGTEELLATAGARIPLQPYTGPGSSPVSFLATTSPVPTSVDRVLTTPFLNIRPHGGGRLLLQAPPLDVRADPHDVPSIDGEIAQELLDRLHASLTDTRAARLESLVVGWRVIPADRQTVAGFVDADRSVYVLATHSGVTLSPLLGRLVREEVLDGVEPDILAPFRPARFADGAELPDPWVVRQQGVQ